MPLVEAPQSVPAAAEARFDRRGCDALYLRDLLDGKSLYVVDQEESPTRVFLVDLASGRKRLWKEFDACGRSGAVVQGILLTPDGTSRVVGCSQWLSNLYFIEGLH